MSPAPASTGSFADELYKRLAPLAARDEQHGWALAHFCSAFGEMFQLVEDVARDTNAGVGWSALVDVDRCPPWALPWLAQLAGVRLPRTAGYGETEAWAASARELIVDAGSRWRGTPQAIRAAAQQHLTGARTVIITERHGSPYRLTVSTQNTETADPAAVEAAVRAAVPAGIVVAVTVLTGDFNTLRDTHTTFNQLVTLFTTFDDMRSDPGRI